jgi:tRNA(His) 5'-end guanylyltransferase
MKEKIKEKKNSLNSRMKSYEACYDVRVPARTYVIIRLDGKGFSKYTKMFEKPFDDVLSNVMDAATVELCKFLSPKFAYTQSDEISLLFTDIEKIESDLIFDGKVQKLCSISASKVTQAFNKIMLKTLALQMPCEKLVGDLLSDKLPQIDAVFDSRVFIIPDFREVSNYFIWRQQDCTRNSVSMAASANFPHKLLEGKSSSAKQDMLMLEKGINWDSYKPKYKRGSIIKKHSYNVDGPNGEEAIRTKWICDGNTPIFTKEKQYLYDLIPTITV